MIHSEDPEDPTEDVPTIAYEREEAEEGLQDPGPGGGG